MQNYHFQTVPEHIKISNVTKWIEFLDVPQNWTAIKCIYVVNTISKIRSTAGRDDIDDDLGDGLDIDTECTDDHLNLGRTFLLENNISYNVNADTNGEFCEWTRGHTWNTTSHDYSSNVLNIRCKETSEKFWKDTFFTTIDQNGLPLNPTALQQPQQVYRNQLRGKQVVAFDVISYFINNNDLAAGHPKGFVLTGECKYWR